MTLPRAILPIALTRSNTCPDCRVPKPCVAGSNPAGGAAKSWSTACAGMREARPSTTLDIYAHYTQPADQHAAATLAHTLDTPTP